ncbi:MAG: hypothetical protein R3C60_00025 [Parvularculaceae bacterium]
MAGTGQYYDPADCDAAWRRPAPKARAAAMALYTWRDPGLSFVISMAAAFPFVIAALLAPALLSFAPTVDILAPIADARAMAAGSVSVVAKSSPFHLALLLAGDLFYDAPGRIHLAAKAFAAIIIVAPFAYFGSARFALAQTALMTAALAAFITAPFSGANEIGLAYFVALATALLAEPADESRMRGVIEGALAGAILFCLWLSNPLFALLGFLALSACPFLTGRSGLFRYGAALFVMVALVGISELLAPGLTAARATAASGALAGVAHARLGVGAWGLAGVAASTAIVIFAAAVFGGAEHWKGWAGALGLVILAVGAARVVGAQPQLVFALAAAIAAFSVASPFYDGVFRYHDRASVAIAGSAAALTLFWTAAVIVQAAGQVSLQYRTASSSSAANIRAELGLVQPGGPTIAKWIEEGRFSTPEARDLFALAPIDQSAMLLEAADRARALTKEGFHVAILTQADTACVIADDRKCSADGRAAAEKAKIVFVPRIDFDAATAVIKGRSEALLYTEFRKVEETPLWEIWVRRGVNPPGLNAPK